MNQSEFSSKSNCNISSLYLQRYKGYYDDTKENNNTQNKNEVINYLNKYKNKILRIISLIPLVFVGLYSLLFILYLAYK